MSGTPYPLRVEAGLDSSLSRWLWLVKWLLAIPHYVVLTFLWLAFAVLTVFAFFAILFTGRYPRPVFEFNVGVLRWAWRVSFYANSALGTDRYPPFTLADVPDYPARLAIDRPERLSRGLVLVKWWLLAIPHYLVLVLLLGGVGYTDDDGVSRGSGVGLIGLLVLVAVVVLLFTGRYPRSIFDLVIGLDRWVLRVTAYAALMTDAYPPFRLDQGGGETPARTAPPDDAPPSAAETPAGATPAGPASADTMPATTTPTGTIESTTSADVHRQQPAPRTTSTPPGPWTAGRVTLVALGGALLLVAGGMLTGGTALAVAETQRDPDGFLMSRTVDLGGPGHAITSEPIRLDAGPPSDTPSWLLGDTKIVVTSESGAPVFIGVAPTSDADSYLAGVERSVLTGVAPFPRYREIDGLPPVALPSDAGIWTASASGEGRQVLIWPIESGDWTVVVMNADAAAPVDIEGAAGATAPFLRAIMAGLFTGGVLLLVVALGLILVPVLTAGPPRKPA